MQACRLSATDIACRRGDRVLFSGLSVSLEPGDILHITGSNGIGKSSLMRILAGLMRPYAGTVEREGAVGLLNENPALDEHLTLGRALDFWRSIDAPDDPAQPWGLEDLLDVPVRYLSTGQRKRAAIARLQAQNAPVWLLDEPLNGLDTHGVSRVGAMVEEHSRAKGICILASHQAFPLNGLKTLDLAEYTG